MELIELHLFKWVSDMARSHIQIDRVGCVVIGKMSAVDLLIEGFKKLMEQKVLVMVRYSGLVARALV